MKVEYAKCDICGTKIEYKPEVEVFKNKFINTQWLDGTITHPKDNQLILQGYTYKNIYDNEYPNKVKRIEPHVINLNLDLCDLCLNDIYGYIINKNQKFLKEEII